TRKMETARRRIERGEETILYADVRLGEPVEQRRLPRVRVADECERVEVAALPGLPLRGTRLLEPGKVTFELAHALEDAPAIDLELRLAWAAVADQTAACATTGALLAQLRPTPTKARQAVAELRQLHLHHALLAARVLGEDVEDQRDAVDDVAREQLLEV